MSRCNRLGIFASLCLIATSISCSNDVAPSDVPNVERISSALTGPIQDDFEDGTTQGWFPFGSPTVANSTDIAFTGTHSLKTTNRTSGFMGPGLSLTGQLSAGASYHVSVATRLVAGQAATGLKVTVMRSFADGTNAFEAVVTSTQVTDQAWVTLSGNYSFASSTNSSGSALSGIIMYVESDSATASYYIDAFSLAQAAPPPIAFDFEDGTAQGWFPFGSPTVANSTDVAFTGTHSLKTTNRTASFMGPGVSMQGKLTKGATYQVTISVRMVAGQPTTTIQPTFQRTPTGGSAAFDSVMTISNVTDQAWVTATALYSFSTDNSGLIFYVQTQSGNASYYIDAVSVAQVAPPPGPPGNTTGASASFESGTLEGWKSRTGGETVANSTADAHGGTHSLLTTNRTATFQGPAFDVTNVMFNGSRYFVSVWAKLAPGQTATQLRVSLQRNIGTITTFHTVVGNTTVDANAWVRLQATYDMALANSQVTMYVESASGTPSFYIDDFSITFVQPAVAERDIPSVYQTMAPFFPIIGAAVIPADIQGEPGFLLSRHFNSMTSGNDMKWDATEKTEGSFTFTQADAEVSFAQTNNMHVRGHTLVWHNQIPAWVFTDPTTGTTMQPSPQNRALLIQRMQNHIQAVMTHFGANVPVWDVVNEPIDPSQPDGLRRSPWYNIIGPDYIAIALQAARAASPTAKLYINDFDTTNPVKRDFLVSLVRSLKSAGVPLDGIGHQMHDNIEYPSPQSVIDAVNLFDTTGVEQAVTEMDVSIYSGSFPTPFTSYTDIPASRHNTVGYSYLGFIQALEQVRSKIVSITIWGTSDDKSWLTSSTKVDAPLLFDPSLKKKPAYWAFVDPLQLAGADLSAALTASPTTVAAGQGIAYAITVTNNADTNQQPFDPTDDDLPAANVTMTMAIPSGTVFQSITVPAGWSCNTPAVNGSGQVVCTIGSLGVGAVGAFGLNVLQNNCSLVSGTSIVASATVSSTTADPNPAPNNTSSATVQVANSPPVIAANGALDMTVECASSFTDPGATATDDCQGSVPVNASSNVDVGHVGNYAVTYTAADAAGGQAAPVVRSVHVADTTPPVVTVAGPNPATVECATAYVDQGATATDSCVGALSVTTAGTVDTSTPGGATLVYTASDPSGNTGTASRLVTISDTTPPVVTLAGPNPATVECGSTFVDPGATAIDACAGLLPVTTTGTVDASTPGSAALVYTAIDPSGNTGAASRLVTVSDTTAPTLTVVDPITIDPPNHKYHAFAIADLVRAASDVCSHGLGIADVVITKASSDEADNGCGDGNTTHDIVIGADCRSIQLRAEREGGGNGRVYTVSLHVTDVAGNRTDATVKVMVPPNGRSNTAVDDGPRVTVPSNCP
jgi:endo-1,4-beta-xylanase